MFIGDSGSYVLGFIFGYLLIEVYITNQNLSPFYIILLVWYPCFETLFSIIRKFRLNRSPILPDINICINYCIFQLKKNLNYRTSIQMYIVQ